MKRRPLLLVVLLAAILTTPPATAKCGSSSDMGDSHCNVEPEESTLAIEGGQEQSAKSVNVGAGEQIVFDDLGPVVGKGYENC